MGQIGVYTGWLKEISEGSRAAITGFDWAGLLLICFVLPAILAPLINMVVRRMGLVKDGDLTL